MNAAALLARAKAAGITILVHDGGLKVTGKPDAIRPLVDDLRAQKVAILALLESEKSAANDAKVPIDQTATPPTLPSPDPFDDRRTCTSCRNLWPGNRCLAHRAAGLKARDLGAIRSIRARKNNKEH